MATDASMPSPVPTSRLATLARLAERLSSAPDQATIFEALRADAAAVVGMDAADVSLVVDDRILSSRIAWPFERVLPERYTDISIDDHTMSAEAARTRRLVVVPDLEAYHAEDPEALADVGASGVVSGAALPFLDAKGDVLGVLGLVARHRVEFDDETVATIQLLGELCGNALRRSQVAMRAGQMAVLAARLSSAVTAEDVAAALRDHGHLPVGARFVNARVADWSTRTLRALVPVDLPAELLRGYETMPVDEPVPLAAAVQQDEPVWVSSLEDCATRFPAGVDNLRTAGCSALASVPLHDSAGSIVGVLGMAWRNPVRFDDLIRATVLTIADLAAQTLERARLTDAQLRHARQREAVAALGQLLSTASTVEEAARLAAEHAPGVVGADEAEIAFDAPPGAEPTVETSDGATVALVPLSKDTTEPFAAVRFCWRDGRALDDDDRELLTSVASTVARTLERARLDEERATDARALERFTAALATAVRRPEVAAAVAERVPPMISSLYASVAVLDPSGRSLEHLSLRGLPPDLIDRFRVVPLDANLAAAVAFRSGRTTTSVVSEVAADDPALADAVARAGIETTAHVVLRDSTGRSMGLLSVGWSTPMRFDEAVLARLEALGDLTGQTLERADLYDSEHQLVATIQERLLGAFPRPPSVELATRYLPAVGAVGIGGDWFDVVPTERGFTLVVGDVTGHGVEAVTAMAQLRTIIAGLLRAGEPLEGVFGRVEAMVDRTDLLLASAELFEIDTSSWKLRYCSAGHPWALLRRAGGAVEVLDEGQQALLGAPLRPMPIPTVQLDPADTLVAYTDGLVERRSEPITTGIERLADRLRRLPPDLSAEAVADALLDASGVARDVGTGAGSASREDDAALVVLRRRDGAGLA